MTSKPTRKDLQELGQLIDRATHTPDESGLLTCVRIGEKLEQTELSQTESIFLNYYLANAWASIRRCRAGHPDHAWGRPERDKTLLYLWKAANSDASRYLDDKVRVRILTNLANELDEQGRFIEAIEGYNHACNCRAAFPMAIGNLGICLNHYARYVTRSFQQYWLLRFACKYLYDSLSSGVEKHSVVGFEKELHWTMTNLSGLEVLSTDKLMDGIDELEDDEKDYRFWCLKKTLFLNALNDLGPFPTAMHDCLSIAGPVQVDGNHTDYIEAFTILRNEFIRARQMLYESSCSRDHYVERHIYGGSSSGKNGLLQIEGLKDALRKAYSIFDKIAVLINSVFDVGIQERNISFKTMWYTLSRRKKNANELNNDIRPVFKDSKNWPLRGLFYLSRDLTGRGDWISCLDPDVRAISQTRHAMEHRFLPVDHDDAARDDLGSKSSTMSRISKDDLLAVSLRTLKMARAALIYTAAAIKCKSLPCS